MRRFRRPTLGLGGLACAALLIATAGLATAASSGSAADSELDVVLGKPREFALKTSARVGKAGEVEFVVRNMGRITHELIVLRTATRAGNLKPRPEEPSKVVEPGFQFELEDIEPGDRVTIALPLKKGHYVLLCNIEGHYAGGMHADLTLR
ncbi:MAG TPA: hypothetical protein VNJ53_13495 [Gaiellaceae bacterium]|nr:hypothetical protein [Gaiellaceae bacterium]